VCGDSTDPDTVAMALTGMVPHLMVTDPPYGVQYDPPWRERAGINGKSGAKGTVLNDDRADWREAWALFPGDVAYVWHGALHAATVAQSLEAAGFALRAQIIWDKTRLVIGRAATKSETGHGTQKPVACMQRPIENNSSPGQAVYEPFSGSGTTIIAAEMTGRVCHAIELSPAYVDVAIKRWQDLTGEQALQVEGGKPFAEVRQERQPELLHDCISAQAEAGRCNRAACR
jgi:DNA modification methylase